MPWGSTVDIDDRLAEYDRDLAHYIPVEEISEEDMKRLASGELPSGVDEPAFIARVKEGIDDIVAAADHEDTVAVFSHGGVINALAHDVMETERLLCVQVDYAGVTRLLWSSQRGQFFVAGVNAHRARMGSAAAKPAVVDKSSDYTAHFAGWA